MGVAHLGGAASLSAAPDAHPRHDEQWHCDDGDDDYRPHGREPSSPGTPGHLRIDPSEETGLFRVDWWWTPRASGSRSVHHHAHPLLVARPGLDHGREVAPVVRSAVLDRYGLARRGRLYAASRLLTTLQLRGLTNGSSTGGCPEAVAGEFVDANALGSRPSRTPPPSVANW